MGCVDIVARRPMVWHVHIVQVESMNISMMRNIVCGVVRHLTAWLVLIRLHVSIDTGMEPTNAFGVVLQVMAMLVHIVRQEFTRNKHCDLRRTYPYGIFPSGRVRRAVLLFASADCGGDESVRRGSVYRFIDLCSG